MSADRIDDAVTKTLFRNYYYAKKRVIYNAQRQNWELAERWALLAAALYEVGQYVWFERKRTDA
jgi:hypothetical protein